MRLCFGTHFFFLSGPTSYNILGTPSFDVLMSLAKGSIDSSDDSDEASPELVVAKKPDVGQGGDITVWMIDIDKQREEYDCTVAAGSEIRVLRGKLANELKVSVTMIVIYKTNSAKDENKINPRHFLNCPISSPEFYYQGTYRITMHFVILLDCLLLSVYPP